MHYIVWTFVFLISINISLEKRFITLEHNYNKYEYHGVLDNFGRDFLELMCTPYPMNRMDKVLELFHQHLGLIHNPYTKLLSKWFLHLKSMNYEQRKDYLQVYKAAIRKKQTALLEFFRAINHIFSTKSRNFNTLLLRLRRYLEEDNLIDMNVEIKEVVRLIYDGVKLLNPIRQKYILTKMRSALKEFSGVVI